MFLPGVENHSQPSGYLDAIEAMRAKGLEYPQIWYLFAFRPEATKHVAAQHPQKKLTGNGEIAFVSAQESGGRIYAIAPDGKVDR